ncbi:TPR repeat protein [Ereboglobus sp. PH5-5]|uniref:tetratricopeptide repeat protein n=1 Tax=Ereboglobus sp. PH5-5 TaxID=2940529 RepID=UPI0024064E34|nr:tetratricopeptide repeat protein [Ereboglobus sp. PH5-5]MDF9833959.1 TPR repeat protein [Ereboglobus sp. PH5-5]
MKKYILILFTFLSPLAFAGRHFDKALELYAKGPSAANQVISELELELKDNPENEQALVLLAIVQRGQAKFDDSIETLKIAENIYIKKEKLNPQIYMLIVENYYFKKDYKKTKELLTAYRALFQDSEELKTKWNALSEAVEKALDEPEKKSDAKEQYNLGLAHLMRGTPKDISTAFKYFQTAAEQGHVNAQYNLAYMYKMGQGTSKDLPSAFKWYQKAAEQGNAWAQHSLALMYRAGEGTPQNLPAAVKWFQKAAEQGDSKGQYNLATMHYHGAGTPKDLPAAFKLYQKAAAQGHGEAQFQLAVAYYDGEGIDKDEVEALAWLYTVKANQKELTDSLEAKANALIKRLEKDLPKKSIKQARQNAKQIQAGITVR